MRVATLALLGLLGLTATGCGADRSQPSDADVEVCLIARDVVAASVDGEDDGDGQPVFTAEDRDAARDRVAQVADRVVFAGLAAPVRDVAGLPDADSGSDEAAPGWLTLEDACEVEGLP